MRVYEKAVRADKSPNIDGSFEVRFCRLEKPLE